jgi:hypothetical protein
MQPPHINPHSGVIDGGVFICRNCGKEKVPPCEKDTYSELRIQGKTESLICWR